MGQKYGKTAEPRPFRFTGTDELVEYDLRAVGKITELGFPDHQRIGFGTGIAVVKSQHGLFGECRVDGQERRLSLTDVLQRQVGITVILVVDHGMTMEKSPAAAVLAGNTYRETGVEQGCVCKGFGITPVHFQFAGAHLLAVLDDPRHCRVQGEMIRRRSKAFRQAGYQPGADCRFDPHVPCRSFERFVID